MCIKWKSINSRSSLNVTVLGHLKCFTCHYWNSVTGIVRKILGDYTAKTMDVFFVSLLYLEILSLVKTCDTTGKVAWQVGEIGPWRYFFRFVSRRNKTKQISIHSSERNMWIAMWYGFAFSKLVQHVRNLWPIIETYASQQKLMNGLVNLSLMSKIAAIERHPFTVYLIRVSSIKDLKLDQRPTTYIKCTKDINTSEVL